MLEERRRGRSLLFISARMRRRSAPNRLTVESSLKHKLTVGVLLLRVKGVCQAWREQAAENRNLVKPAPSVPSPSL